MPATSIGSGTTGYEIMDSGRTYVLLSGDLLNVSNDTAIFASNLVSSSTVNIKGQITQSGMGVAIETDGSDMTVHIFDKASVLGNEGVLMTGANAVFVNDGTLHATGAPGLSFSGPDSTMTNNGSIVSDDPFRAAIEAFGTDSKLINNGDVEGAYGINISDAKVTVTLGDKSTVTGTEAAIFSESTEATDKIRLTNEGQITGKNGGYAIELQDSNDTIINHGTINGRIYMGSGKDTFDNRGGTLDHKVEGGAGDDTLITSSIHTKLKENGGSEGFDTVKSTVSYTLSENVEQLILLGNKNINGTGTQDGSWLLGNSGDNKLFGVDGSGSDTFIFKTGGGHDTLMDYDAGIDKIDVRKWNGIDNFNDVKQHATDSGGAVHITLGSDELIVANTHVAGLHKGDFIFDF